MITVKPIQTKTEQERLCALCHIPYRTELLAYGAYNNQGDFVGMCQFGMDAEGDGAELGCPRAARGGGSGAGQRRQGRCARDVPGVDLTVWWVLWRIAVMAVLHTFLFPIGDEGKQMDFT